MCLDVDKQETIKLKKKLVRHAARKRTVVFYKVLAYKVLCKENYQSKQIRLFAPILNQEYKPGINKADKVTRFNQTTQKQQYIKHGIHVYRSLKEAKKFKSYNELIIQVQCNAKYFVAANKNQAVFSQIIIPTDTFKILNEQVNHIYRAMTDTIDKLVI